MDFDDDLAQLARLVARARGDAQCCRVAAARAEALVDVRWQSPAAVRFRQQLDHRAGQLRRLAGSFEALVDRLEHLSALVRRAGEG